MLTTLLVTAGEKHEDLAPLFSATIPSRANLHETGLTDEELNRLVASFASASSAQFPSGCEQAEVLFFDEGRLIRREYWWQHSSFPALSAIGTYRKRAIGPDGVLWLMSDRAFTPLPCIDLSN